VFVLIIPRASAPQLLKVEDLPRQCRHWATILGLWVPSTIEYLASWQQRSLSSYLKVISEVRVESLECPTTGFRTCTVHEKKEPSCNVPVCLSHWWRIAFEAQCLHVTRRSGEEGGCSVPDEAPKCNGSIIDHPCENQITYLSVGLNRSCR
jgi:hypothetical protein